MAGLWWPRLADGVAAWAVVWQDAPEDFALGLSAKDQSPHRAQVECLFLVLSALNLVEVR